MILLEPRVYPTMEDALRAPDWRALDYVEQFDDGWIAVYAGDKLMVPGEGIGRLLPRDQFRRSGVTRDPRTLRTVSMYGWGEGED